MKRILPTLAVSLLLVACTDDPVGPAAEVEAPLAARAPKAHELFARYVSLGTSVSMGVQGAGIYDNAQLAAWPNQLASRLGVPFSLPLIEDPGCPPPLLAPLALNLALLGAFSAFGAGDDLLDGLAGVCMPLQAGISPPTGNVAISGADVHDVRFLTPELAAARSARRGELYSRVLAPGQTQLTAALSLDPTFFSLEAAANEILPASTGLVSALTPYESWQADYDAVVAALRSTGAGGLIVGLPHRAANFPSIRTSREFFNEWPYLLGLGIAVSWTCYFSSNHLFLPGYLLTLLSQSPTTATCADKPGEVDYVLTRENIATIDALMAQMNAHMQSVASENDWAYAELAAVYDLPKNKLDLSKVLFSDEPFGPYMSIDGVHPNAAGQALLANAAVEAIQERYRVRIK